MKNSHTIMINGTAHSSQNPISFTKVVKRGNEKVTLIWNHHLANIEQQKLVKIEAYLNKSFFFSELKEFNFTKNNALILPLLFKKMLGDLFATFKFATTKKLSCHPFKALFSTMFQKLPYNEARLAVISWLENGGDPHIDIEYCQGISGSLFYLLIEQKDFELLELMLSSGAVPLMLRSPKHSETTKNLLPTFEYAEMTLRILTYLPCCDLDYIFVTNRPLPVQNIPLTHFILTTIAKRQKWPTLPSQQNTEVVVKLYLSLQDDDIDDPSLQDVDLSSDNMHFMSFALGVILKKKYSAIHLLTLDDVEIFKKIYLCLKNNSPITFDLKFEYHSAELIHFALISIANKQNWPIQPTLDDAEMIKILYEILNSGNSRYLYVLPLHNIQLMHFALSTISRKRNLPLPILKDTKICIKQIKIMNVLRYSFGIPMEPIDLGLEDNATTTEIPTENLFDSLRSFQKENSKLISENSISDIIQLLDIDGNITKKIAAQKIEDLRQGRIVVCQAHWDFHHVYLVLYKNALFVCNRNADRANDIKPGIQCYRLYSENLTAETLLHLHSSPDLLYRKKSNSSEAKLFDIVSYNKCPNTFASLANLKLCVQLLFALLTPAKYNFSKNFSINASKMLLNTHIETFKKWEKFDQKFVLHNTIQYYKHSSTPCNNLPLMLFVLARHKGSLDKLTQFLQSQEVTVAQFLTLDKNQQTIFHPLSSEKNILALKKVAGEHWTSVLKNLIDKQDINKKSPLWTAASEKNWNLAKALVLYGADPNAYISSDNTKSPTWFQILSSKDQKIIQFFIEQGASVDLKDSLGNTALHKVVEVFGKSPSLEKEACMQLLIEAGIPPLNPSLLEEKKAINSPSQVSSLAYLALTAIAKSQNWQMPPYLYDPKHLAELCSFLENYKNNPPLIFRFPTANSGLISFVLSIIAEKQKLAIPTYQNIQAFTIKARWVKYLGHRFGIPMKMDLGFGYNLKISTEGASGYTRSLNSSLVDFNSQHSNLLSQDLIKDIMQLLYSSQIQTEDIAAKKIKDFQAGKIVVASCRWHGESLSSHRLYLVLYKNVLFTCNRGAFRDDDANPGIQCYRFKDTSQFTAEHLFLLSTSGDLLRNPEKRTTLGLEPKRFDDIPHKEQPGGFCAWDNLKRCFHLLLSLLNSTKAYLPEQFFFNTAAMLLNSHRETYKTWAAFDRQLALEYAIKFYEQNPQHVKPLSLMLFILARHKGSLDKLTQFLQNQDIQPSHFLARDTKDRTIFYYLSSKDNSSALQQVAKSLSINNSKNYKCIPDIILPKLQDWDSHRG